jgi:aminopeptidase-like protein
MTVEPDMLDRNEMWQLMERLFPICRSITGNGVRETLAILSELMPGMTLHEVPTGTQVLDWVIPKEWNIRDAYVANEHGERVIDFQKSNLHVVGYSIPVNAKMSLKELDTHLHSLPDQPDAIPYITSYYKERWGFCLAHSDREQLKEGEYHVVIDSDLINGSLTYGELIIPGESEKEVFLSTYICHPSMANNELSGPIVMTAIAKWIASQPRQFTYRIIFIPETIGSITYLSKNHETLKKNVIAGFNLSCIGDEGQFSYVASRYGNTLADQVASNVLEHRHANNFKKYSFLERGSDERQYCSPGIDLPLVSLCRSKYSTYPEYHTSLDNLEFVTRDGLQGGFEYVRDCLYMIENNKIYKSKCLGEPQLGKRGLYPNLSTKNTKEIVSTMMDFIAYADGKNNLLEISNIIGKPVWEIAPIAKELADADLLDELDSA